MPCPHGHTHTEADSSGWKKGPMPAGTYMWGAVVPWNADGTTGTGFYFADFFGDHVLVIKPDETVKMYPHEIAFYFNGIGLPPQVKK